MLHLRVTGDLSGLTRVQMPVGASRIFVADLGRCLADEEVGPGRDADQVVTRVLAKIEATVPGVGDRSVFDLEIEGQCVGLAGIVSDRDTGERAVSELDSLDIVTERPWRHVVALEHRERQPLLALTFEVEGVEEGDVPDDVMGREQVEPREGDLVVPAEAGFPHLVAQAGLQEALKTAVVRVGMADGQVPDLVRLFPDVLESLGDVGRAVEEQVLITVTPADEEARVGATLGAAGGEADSGSEDVDFQDYLRCFSVIRSDIEDI